MACMEFSSSEIEKIKHDKWSADPVYEYVKLHKLFNSESAFSTGTLYNYIDLGLIMLTNKERLL